MGRFGFYPLSTKKEKRTEERQEKKRKCQQQIGEAWPFEWMVESWSSKEIHTSLLLIQSDLVNDWLLVCNYIISKMEFTIPVIHIHTYKHTEEKNKEHKT